MNIHNLTSRHSNILKGVVIGKKSWGLFSNEWTNGINEWCFTREEILGKFEKYNIKIPNSLLKEFDNMIQRKRIKRIEEEIKRLKK